MLKYFVPPSLVLGAVLLWSTGCQSEPKNALSPRPAVEDSGTRLNASTYFAHGHLLERQGNYEGAVDQYQRALALAPQMTSARNRLGITLNKLGRHAEATSQFRLAVQQNPTDGYLQNNLGFSLYLEGRYTEALAALAAALELQPDYARAHMNKGIVLAKTGDYASALTEFTLAAGEAEAHYNLAVIQAEAEDYAAAAHSLESALNVNPSFEAARQQLHVVARLAARAESAMAAAPVAESALAEVPATEIPEAQSPAAETPVAELPATVDTSVPAGGAPAQDLAADAITPVRPDAATADSEAKWAESWPLETAEQAGGELHKDRAARKARDGQPIVSAVRVQAVRRPATQ